MVLEDIHPDNTTEAMKLLIAFTQLWSNKIKSHRKGLKGLLLRDLLRRKTNEPQVPVRGRFLESKEGDTPEE